MLTVNHNKGIMLLSLTVLVLIIPWSQGDTIQTNVSSTETATTLPATENNIATTLATPITGSNSKQINTKNNNNKQHVYQRAFVINRGIRPFVYGYNTGIHPYSVTYNYPLTETTSSAYPVFNPNSNPFFQNDGVESITGKERIEVGLYS